MKLGWREIVPPVDDLDLALVGLHDDAMGFEDDDPGLAEAKLREGLTRIRQVDQPSPFARRTAAAIEEDLVMLLVRRGAFDEASLLAQRCLADASDPRSRARLGGYLAEACEKRCDLAGAERALLDAIASTAHLPDRQPSSRIAAIDGLGRFYARTGRAGDAARAARDLDDATERAIEAVAIGFYRRDGRSELERIEAGARPIQSLEIYALSHGRVSCGETFDADGLAVPGGLRCYRIFGPLRDHGCSCGALPGSGHANRVCERCQVEELPASARRTRCGHLSLGTRLSHPRWRAAVAAWVGAEEDAITTMLDLDRAWNDAKPWLRPGTPLVDALVALSPQDTEGMLIDVVPVLPPDRPLPPGLRRDDLDAAYAEVLNHVGGDHGALVRSVDRLFALFG